jgi:pentose-5-phosphate-3-epimerase
VAVSLCVLVQNVPASFMNLARNVVGCLPKKTTTMKEMKEMQTANLKIDGGATCVICITCTAAGCDVKIAEVFLTSTNNVAKNVRVITSVTGY